MNVAGSLKYSPDRDCAERLLNLAKPGRLRIWRFMGGFKLGFRM